MRNNRSSAVVYPDAREGFITFDGPWGSIHAGRFLGLFSRGATEIAFLYAHGPERLLIGRYCAIASGVRFLMPGGNQTGH